MTEYIEKSELYKEIAELEDYARYRFLSTKGNSTLYLKRMIQLDELTRLKHIIHDFPAADTAEVQRGHWEFPIFTDSDDGLDPRVKCSECGGIEAAFARWKYCPNCGAKMVED